VNIQTNGSKSIVDKIVKVVYILEMYTTRACSNFAYNEWVHLTFFLMCKGEWVHLTLKGPQIQKVDAPWSTLIVTSNITNFGT